MQTISFWMMNISIFFLYFSNVSLLLLWSNDDWSCLLVALLFGCVVLCWLLCCIVGRSVGGASLGVVLVPFSKKWMDEPLMGDFLVDADISAPKLRVQSSAKDWSIDQNPFIHLPPRSEFPATRANETFVWKQGKRERVRIGKERKELSFISTFFELLASRCKSKQANETNSLVRLFCKPPPPYRLYRI